MSAVKLPLMRPHEYDWSKIRRKHLVMISPKLDGVRTQIYGQVYTRTGELIIGADHYAEALARVAPSVAVEGEFYHHELDFDTVSGMVRDHNIIYRKGQTSPKIYLFDILNSSNTFTKRQAQLAALKAKLPSDMFGLVPTWRCRPTQKKLDGWYKLYLKQGYEGMMVKTRSHHYQDCRPSKRSWDWMRRKPELTADATIIDVIEGKGKYAGAVGAFRVEDSEGRRFKCGGGKLKDKERFDLFRHPEFVVGAAIQFSYARRNQAGGYRHPRFAKWRKGGISL